MVILNNEVKNKRIRILTRGPIYQLGGVYGPTVPMVKTVEEIAIYVQARLNVVEVDDEGEVIAKLDLTNYNKNLQGEVEQKAQTEPAPLNTDGEVVEEEAKEEVVEPVVEAPVIEPQKQPQQNNQKNNNNFSKEDRIVKK